MTHVTDVKDYRAIRLWLGFMIFLVVSMIVLGGATRLTNSGLSITEWKPITGAIPPLSQADWLSEFEKYKQIPEFEAEHPDMTLLEFEFIYFMEWAHRQLGRLIGLSFLVPLVIFLRRRSLTYRLKYYGIGVLILIGIQGAIGWWMVASGLVNDRVDVSQYRLATHLGVAFIILGLLIWMFNMVKTTREPSYSNYTAEHGSHTRKINLRSKILLGAVYIQIIAGAFVAGTHAGKTYNTWPLMDGDFVPEGYAMMSPFWRNFFENIPAIQFNHRVLAYLVTALSIWVIMTAFRYRVLQKASVILGGLIVWQVLLGIWTLLAGAPLWLALFHQFTSIWVFIASVWLVRKSDELIHSQAH